MSLSSTPLDIERANMTRDKQMRLQNRICTLLERSGATPVDILAFLVSFTWGWARRIGWKSPQLIRYCMTAFETNDKRLSPNYSPPGVSGG